jgi:Fe-S-cluster containining protein
MKKNTKRARTIRGEVIVDGVNLTRDFRCHCCGHCCRGNGYVKLTRADEVRLAEHLGLALSVFRERYCIEEWSGAHILQDHAESDACIFLDEATNRCTVHAVKPEQCVGFPFKWRAPDFFETCEGFLAAKRKTEGAA